jgi:hypothetical protein
MRRGWGPSGALSAHNGTRFQIPGSFRQNVRRGLTFPCNSAPVRGADARRVLYAANGSDGSHLWLRAARATTTAPPEFGKLMMDARIKLTARIVCLQRCGRHTANSWLFFLPITFRHPSPVVTFVYRVGVIGSARRFSCF